MDTIVDCECEQDDRERSLQRYQRRPITANVISLLRIPLAVAFLLYPVVAPLMAVALAAMGTIALRDYFAATSSPAAGERGRPIAPAGSA
jgi:hypothetical protein